jgi:hypothetical protein
LFCAATTKDINDLEHSFLGSATTSTLAAKPSGATMSPVAQFAVTPEQEPAGAKQRIAEHEPHSRQDRKWMQPAKHSPGVLTLHDRCFGDDKLQLTCRMNATALTFGQYPAC